MGYTVHNKPGGRGLFYDRDAGTSEKALRGLRRGRDRRALRPGAPERGPAGGLSLIHIFLRALEARENTARITLDDSATSAAVLGRLLTALREDRYDYHVAVETEF